MEGSRLRRTLSRMLLPLVAGLAALAGTAGAAHFPDPSVSARNVTLSGSPTVNGSPLQAGDEIAVWSIHPNPALPGKWERSLVGHALLSGPSFPGIPVYGDDVTTSAVVEGAVPGEELCLQLWRASDSKEYSAYLGPGSNPVTVTWSNAGDSLSADGLDFVEGQRIPLRTGQWNLVSFGGLKGYYKTPSAPVNPQLAGVSWSQAATMGDSLPLKSIEGKYDRVLGNDGAGMRTWDPSRPTFSTLATIGPGYGYWIHMKPASNGQPLAWMTVQGARATGAEPLDLGVGWTLAGYWGRVVYNDIRMPGSPQSELLPVDGRDNVALPSMGDLWNSVSGNYARINGFDGGTKIWDPARPTFATLKYMGPGYGYWIKMTAPAALSYSVGLADPTVPRDLAAAVSNDQVIVTWSPVPGAVSYNLYWSAVPGFTTATGTRIANAASPCILSGLPAGIPYYFIVTSVGSGGESSGSARASVPSGAISRPGPDIGQYFDRGIQAPGAANLWDNSSHPLRGLTTSDATPRFSGTANCLWCHYASGPARTSDECLMCHFENQPNAPASNHGDRVLQLAAVTGNGLPASVYPISTVADYDSWCLQCHGGGAAGLGGKTPSGKTLIDPARFAGGRHRASNGYGLDTGCIHCHAPHGSGNTRLVRSNPSNRRNAGSTPLSFGPFPADSLAGGGYGVPQNVPYRARIVGNLADAADDHGYCNKACHIAGLSISYSKERMYKRDGTTGLYRLNGVRKIYLTEGVERTVDNVMSRMHGHVNNEIIPTEDMVLWYEEASGMAMSRYHYPGSGGASPQAYDNAVATLPLFPDYPDGSRDFTNGYLDEGLIRYRFTCSTCHDPHGSVDPALNGLGAAAYPDLRMRKIPGDLCNQCHR